MTDLFDAGLKEGWALIAEKNLGARKVLESIGMRRDGIERIRGVSHKRPIKWLRYSVTA
jgi:RimJ/RimL family protein N-acetyltransferase